jgi:hypothetical protein
MSYSIAFLNLFKAVRSILELCFKRRSWDFLAFDPRKAILLKFTIHSTLSLICGWFHQKLRDTAIFQNFFGLIIRLPGARSARAAAVCEFQKLQSVAHFHWANKLLLFQVH